MKRFAVVIVALTAGCMVGPDYKRPDAPVPTQFKELAGWRQSQPQDAADKGDWWAVYHDPELDRLERMVEVSNQTVKQFEAEYRNAVALVGEARAGLFPTVGVNSSVTRGTAGGGGGGGGGGSSGFAGGGSGGGGRSATTITVSAPTRRGTSMCGDACGVRWRAMSREPR